MRKVCLCLAVYNHILKKIFTKNIHKGKWNEENVTQMQRKLVFTSAYIQLIISFSIISWKQGATQKDRLYGPRK